MAKEIGLPIRKLPKKYFALPNCGSNKNQETFAYLIGNQTQCHRTLIQHHAILHEKDAGMQHPFQLYQQRNHFYSFISVIHWQETTMAVKKKFYLCLLA